MNGNTRYDGLFHRDNKAGLNKVNNDDFEFSGNYDQSDINYLSEKITISIGDEIRDSSLFLSSMNDTFSNTNVTLRGIMKNMKCVAKQQNIGWFHFFLFIFFICILFWGLLYFRF
ncbi:uncharacterized protein T551_01718 [Pneumocystis jirovecii RU7]|uniref:t-SNARE coiled-coil homology domain-containing protein n=1 Tax=Pneumocystis jirovecii (strain RU7) TaxID=1408657 RepID=A0A0W4ZPZ6_PNEJ7|nr:uncharacterized protein T551_01718 [Pneumocystis jirovecii RU7]KTW30435.1 hypothetical protein T551_01718 [Pneumocystis jirovecii RU7]